MKLRRRNPSEDPQTIHRRRLSQDKPDEFLSKIPLDVAIEIFSKLPLKSIAKCRCASKRWTSVLNRPDFTESFLTKSLARPQLLLALCKDDKKEVIFFSTPQPQNLDHEDDSSPRAVANHNLTFTFDPLVTVNHHVSFPFESVYDISSSTISGFVLVNDDRLLGRRKTREVVSVICNPSTGQYFTLPKMITRKRTWMGSYLGYDPVEKQHKVLVMVMLNKSVVDHQVLTLGGNNGNNMRWRLIECDIPAHHHPRPDSVCISGVLYYTARASIGGGNMVICFDVRSEKYSFVELGMHDATLVEYNGKLASVRSHPEPYIVSERSTSFEMWVLEKHEWSKRIFNLPPMWKGVVAGKVLHFVGVTAANEFVLSPTSSSKFYHVYYYNFDKETVTRVEIQGMALDRGYGVVTFLNHVEDVKLIDLV